MATCNAVIRLAVGAYGLDPVACTQVVGVRTYVTTGSLRVGYCAREGHQANVRGRFAEQRDPEWPGDLPEYADEAVPA